MAPVTTTRTLMIAGYAFSDGTFYPADHTPRRDAIADAIDICLHLEITAGPRVTASFAVGLLYPTGSLPPWRLPLSREVPPQVFNPHGAPERRHVAVSVSRDFLNVAPDPRYLTRGGLLLECTLTVFTAETPAPAPAPTAAARARARAPASDMMEQLAEIYATGDGADVTCSVQRMLFRAHMIVLAMRSPVLKAQLFGGMMESTARLIEVEDMAPDVFEALLRYIYTDALPGADDEDGQVDEDATEVTSHLLVAADRYGVERLRALCEAKLCDLVDAGSLVRMLVFAEERHCDMLKDACVELMASSDGMAKVVAKPRVRAAAEYPPFGFDRCAGEVEQVSRGESMLNLSFGGMNVGN
ncbi:BTB/POZ and MATH domain-containing protein 2-like [Panicum miliaceum]|uniref:BTB/POZ and MATH domain-containing protein 2-like n=1 Tax=Panicum miliaceum TaxID=4540 RepID=A0A3L6RL53_PANMI|nr:BTB/POZ and MATH domain-containing protein 2-like [Panicum miliaceum]